LGNTTKVDFLEKEINYIFRDKSLIQDALTHPSANNCGLKSQYQRLEFLGDSVLNLIITTSLLKDFPNINEGALTIKRSQIINRKTLSKCAKAIKLDNYLIVGKSVNIITEKILCDTYEALIGAIKLDSNIESANTFVNKTLLKKIESYRTQTNHKGELIEYYSKNKMLCPKFITELDNHSYISKVTLEANIKTFFASGKTKKEAENNLSKKILYFLKKS